MCVPFIKPWKKILDLVERFFQDSNLDIPENNVATMEILYVMIVPFD